jgi:hypothetical protein
MTPFLAETKKIFTFCRSTCALKRPQVLPATRSLTLPASNCALTNQTTPFLADKRLTLIQLNVRFFKRSRILPAVWSPLLTLRYQQRPRFLWTKDFRFFRSTCLSYATLDLACGLKPATQRALTTTNTTLTFLLIPRSVLLTLATRDSTKGAVFSS